MRGDLNFDATFECGNLLSAKRLSKIEWELKVRPDTNNEKFRLWFYFKVNNVERNQLVLFSIPNMSKGRSSYREGMSPLVKSMNRPTWQRVPSENVVYYRVPKTKSYTLSFFFQFDDFRDSYSFAYSYPYSYTDLQKYLHHVDSVGYPFYERSLLVRSVQHRRVDLLTITNPPSPSHGDNPPLQNKQITKKKHVIVLSARIHPGESPAQFVMQGVIDFLLSSDMRANILRDHIIFKIIPMLNPDGVYLGNYRCNSLGYDMNRYWGEPHPLLHPEVNAARQLLLSTPVKQSSSSHMKKACHSSKFSDILSLQQSRRSSNGSSSSTSKQAEEEDYKQNMYNKYHNHEDRVPCLDFFIDIHSHSNTMNAFTYGNSVERALDYPLVSVPSSSNNNKSVNSSQKLNKSKKKGIIDSGAALCKDNGGGGMFFPHLYSPLHPNRSNMNNALPDERIDIKKSLFMWEHESRFPKLLSDRNPAFSFSECKFDSDPTKAGTGRRAIGELLGYPVKCYTLETSFYGSVSGIPRQVTPFTPERYLNIGRDLVIAFLDYYEDLSYDSY